MLRSKFYNANEAFNCVLHELKTTGIDFDNKRGNNYVRFSYACEKIELEESLKLIKNWL